MDDRVPTSAVLDKLLRSAPSDDVTLAWIVAQLHERSFGIVILLLALVGKLSGASLIAAVLLAIPAIQMVQARLEPVLPNGIMQRRVSTTRLAWLVCRLTPICAAWSVFCGRGGVPHSKQPSAPAAESFF